ncbi:Acg family FMN-binding oxidoreductase [Halorussus amylolyticus]|uniref:Acg family FMN-binding oxidoreductase n=1 Tax=Halorussus amylolyticus TaxID=1126242 RepID=UPI00104A1261|nr:nitroreductase family protein [Halorussus amylolyticus]
MGNRESSRTGRTGRHDADSPDADSGDGTPSNWDGGASLRALVRGSWRRKWAGSTEPWNVSETGFPDQGTLGEKAQFLLRYAVLAPSSHNSQPWLFTVFDDEIRLFADRERWLRVADPDRRELHLSLGAALENLLIAVEHFGLGHDVEYVDGSFEYVSSDEFETRPAGNFGYPSTEDSGPTVESVESAHVATVTLAPERDGPPERDSRLFDAIVRRRTNRGPYQERPIPKSDLGEIVDACTDEGVSVQLVADPETKADIAALAARANRRQFADPAYRRELARWVGRGAFGDSWPEAKVGKFLLTHLDIGRQQARKDAERLRTAPVAALLRTDSDDRKSRLCAGQAFERMSLLATALDVRTHSMSAVLEVPSLRRELADASGGSTKTPQHLFRLGYARGVGAPSPRRPPEAVLLD